MSYSKMYGLKHAIPMMVFYIFNAAIMHVSTRHFKSMARLKV